MKSSEKKVKEYVDRTRRYIDEDWLNDGGFPEWFAFLQSPQGIMEVAKMIQREELNEK